MATGIRFPSDLRVPDRNGYAEVFEDTRSAVEMEIGTVRRRNRHRKPPRLFDLQWTFSQDDFQVFDIWWQDTIEGGAKQFDIQLLDNDETIVWYTVTAKGEYRAEVVNELEWRVTMQVKALDDNFGTTRLAGTDELRGIVEVGVTARGNLVIPRTLRGRTEVGVTASARFGLQPLRGLAEVGLFRLPQARFSIPVFISGRAELSFTGTAYFPEDYSSSLLLLLHMTGSDGGTTFIDESTLSRAVTVVAGGVETSTDDAVFGSSSTEFFTSPGHSFTQGLTLGLAGDLAEYADFNTGPWTVRGWIKIRYPGVSAATALAIEWQNISTGQVLGISLNFTNFDGVTVSPSWTFDNVLATPSTAGELLAAPNEWFHFAFTKSADGKNRCYINGKSVVRRIEGLGLADWFYGGGFIHEDATVTIGKSIISGALNGFMQEFSIHDEEIYTADFAPPRYAAENP